MNKYENAVLWRRTEVIQAVSRWRRQRVRIELGPVDEAEVVEAFEFAVGYFNYYGDWDDSVRFAKVAIRSGFRTGQIYLMGASSFAKKKALKEARDFLLRGADLLIDNPSFHYDLACYECRLGNSDRTEKRLKRALQLDESLAAKAVADPDLESLWEPLCTKWNC